ncbi:VWA domain-containing protein [Azospirillum sp. YIM DDC1]|uniref:VWA domain-containing protein n=2 Tax=Azospirillum aestuarii TaxID=2802052 RepID=A0ABS1HS09_9PROT|nr:vWA domain-containing protein [Azospirillum aestuarii]MBK4717616.1 VWA domain-containing protein [Azospirillum aestuarii]
MSYGADISRANPTCFLFVIDQSGSMDERMETGRSKAEFVADVLNKTLVQVITRCTRSEGVRNYFDMGVIAYGGSGVLPGFKGQLSSGFLHPLAAIEAAPLRVEERRKKVDDGAGGLVEQSVKFPVWFEPVNSGGTPMCDALRKAAEVLVAWCDSHPDSYPPTVIHVTDGQSTDGDPSQIAEALKQISTNDGACLLFNLHIDTAEGGAIIFPSSETALPDAHSRMLFRMSSNFPPHLIDAARSKGYDVNSESRFFGYKAGIEGIADFFNIGTQASNLR